MFNGDRGSTLKAVASYGCMCVCVDPMNNGKGAILFCGFYKNFHVCVYSHMCTHM